jgi:hypothetical protein
MLEPGTRDRSELHSVSRCLSELEAPKLENTQT